MKGTVKKNRTQPSAPDNRRRKDDYIPRFHYEEKKSYANVILVAIVVIILLYLYFKWTIHSSGDRIM